MKNNSIESNRTQFKEITILKEFCAENFTHVKAAIEQGAGRVELCDNLAVGGTTPSIGVIKQTLAYCKPKQIPVMTMIRPRGGDFVYKEEEIEIMKADIQEAVRLKIDGIVIGCLTEDGRIDRKAMKQLLDLRNSTQVTFHMAFDQIPESMQFEEMEWLISQKVNRILTHGAIGGQIDDHIGRLNELIDCAKSRIEILPGGGITYHNLPYLAGNIHTDQFHGTKIVKLSI